MIRLRHSFFALVLACCTPVSAAQPETCDAATGTVDATWVPFKGLVRKHRNVLIIGDSEACAVSNYTRHVQDAHDSVYVDCKVSTTVPYWAAQGNFREALSRHPKPDAVLVFLGTNHYWDAKANPDVKPILDIVKAEGIDCVWVGNVAVKGRKWPINNALRASVQPTCSYFDTETAGIPLADGVHPTGDGALKWLRAVWPMIPSHYEERHD